MSAWRRTFWGLFVLFNVGALAGLFFVRARIQAEGAASPLPVYGSLRPFSMTGESGEPFDSGVMKGKAWVINFMFTSCPNECPAMNFKMAVLQNVLPAEVGLISFSVDPEKDTPEVLQKYSRDFQAQKGRWHFLTGDRQAVGGLLEDCRFARADDPLLHALRLVLVDGQGRVRGYYDYTDKDLAKKLSADIKSLSRKG